MTAAAEGQGPDHSDRAAVAAFVGLGANLGHPERMVRWALQRLDDCPGLHLLAASSLYRSAPVQASGPDFINAVACLHTVLDPMALLRVLQSLEDEAGRQRPYRNAPRSLDLDLLLFGDARMDSPWLTVPHPRMNQRAFVLLPLAELAPERVDARALQAVAGQELSRIGRAG